MTKAQASQFSFLQERISAHLKSGGNARAERIANVLVEAARRAHPEELNPAKADPPAANTRAPMPGHAPHSEDSQSPITSLDDHARLRFDIFFQAAEVHRQCGNVNGAEAAFREALQVAAERPGEIDPLEIAHINHNYASLHDQLGDEAAAELFYQAALDQLLDLDPPPLDQIANISNNLAMISRNQGKLDLAEQRYLKALEIFEQLRGPDHLEVAVVCNNLGSLYWIWHHPEMALNLHRRALSIRRKQLPDNDPDIGQSACNLAAVYHDLKNFEKASLNYQHGLKILLQHIEADPDSYQLVANNYADLFRENGEDKKADSLLKKVERQLKTKTKSVGENA